MLSSLLRKASLLVMLLLCLPTKASTIVSPSVDDFVVQIAVTELPFSFSPFTSLSAIESNFPILNDINRGSSSQYNHLFFDPMVRWGNDRKIEYRLISKLETIEKHVTRIYLKKNIAFHSGNLLTSKDVIWSLNEALRNKKLHKKLQHIIEINPIDDHQLDIQTQLTRPQLLDYLSHLFILDSDFYIKNRIDHNAMQTSISPSKGSLALSGTGPYRVSSFYSGVSLRVQANRSYWGQQPQLKTLNFVKVKSKQSRLYALLAGDIDISEAIDNENINSVHFLDNKQVYQTASTNTLFLLINELSNPIFKDASVRNAIHLALNQAGMLKHILNGTGTIGNSFANTTFDHEQHPLHHGGPSQADPFTSPRDDILVDPIYDTELAKLLLDNLSSPKRLSLLVLVDENSHTNEVVLAIKNMLLRVGIQLLTTEVETLERWNKFQFEYDLLLSNWQTGLFNPDNIYQDIFNNSPLSDYLSLRFNEVKQPLDLQQKIKLFDQYQSQDYIVPVFSQNEIWATDKKFNITDVFSVNAIPYWHQLKLQSDDNAN